MAVNAVYGSGRDRALHSVPLPLQLKVTGDGSVGVEIGEWEVVGGSSKAAIILAGFDIAA